MATFVLHPGAHKITVPNSGLNVPKDIHRFMLGMASSLRELLSIHENTKKEDPDLILEAFEIFLSSSSPKLPQYRQFEIYKTYVQKEWMYSLWLINILRYFVNDKGKLVHRICEVRKVREQEKERNLEAAKYWDPDMMPEGFSGTAEPSQESDEVIFPEDFDL